MNETWTFLGLLLTGTVAGGVNAIAGGGPILTLGGLALLGIDPRIASLTSTVALSPGQIVAGAMASRSMTSLGWARARMAFAIRCAAIGGAGGGVLLLQTSTQGFRAIVPWLVLFATVIYALAGGRGLSGARWQVPAPAFLSILLGLGIYGGYFGGGNSFLVLALLALSGLSDKQAALAKNMLVAAINAGAVAIFVLSALVQWSLVLPLAAGGLIGSAIGARALDRIRPALLRPTIIASGLALAAWLML